MQKNTFLAVCLCAMTVLASLAFVPATTLAAPSYITITSPPAGYELYPDDYFSIYWEADGDDYYDAFLYLDGVQTHVLFENQYITGTYGFYYYSIYIPNDASPSTLYQMKVQTNGGIVSDYSEYFTILAPTAASIEIYYPYAYDEYTMGEEMYVYWTVVSGGVSGYYDIDLYKGGVWVQNVATNVDASYNNYYWTIPTDLVPGTDYTLRVKDHDGSPEAYSSQFSLLAPAAASLDVTTPNAYTTWYAGYGNYIYWETTGTLSGAYDIDLYDNGVWVQNIVSNYNYYGSYCSYYWTAPSGLSTGSNYQILVSDHDGDPDDFSVYFYIQGTAASEADNYEEDDVMGMAATLPYSTTQERTVYPAYDLDWMSFSVTVPSLVEASAWPSDNYMDLDIEIRDASGDIVTAGKYDYYTDGADGEAAACLEAGTYYVVVSSEYDTGSYSVYLTTSTAEHYLAAPTALPLEEIWGMKYDVELGGTLESVLDTLEENLGDSGEYTIEESIVFNIQSYGYTEVTEVGTTTSTIQTEVAEHLLIDASVSVTGPFPNPGTYENGEEELEANQGTRTVSVSIEFEQYFSLSMTTTLRNSDLAVTSNEIDMTFAARGTGSADNFPAEEEEAHTYPDYSWTTTVSYEDYSVSVDISASAHFEMTYSEGYPLIRFPLCEGASWAGEAPMHVEGTWDGTVDVSGLPEEATSEDGPVFPIDLGSLPDEDPGFMSEDTTMPYAMKCVLVTTDASGTHYHIAPMVDGEATEGATVIYTPETGFISGMEMEMTSEMLEEMDENLTGITIPKQTVVMIDSNEAKDQVAALRSDMDEFEDEGKLFCLSWFDSIAVAIPLLAAGAVVRYYRKKRK